MRRSASFARVQWLWARAKRLPVVSSPLIALLNACLVDPERASETRGGLLSMDGVMAGVGAAVTRDQVPHEARVVNCGATRSLRSVSTCAPSSARRGPSIAR